MATIFPRHNKDGSTSWRVMIRRKGLKSFITSFSSLQEAKKFIDDCEEKYCLDPDNFNYNALLEKRKKEFARKSRKKNDIL